MELRTVDPRSLKPNPNNPRKVAAPDGADDALMASIRAVGLLQPPVVRQKGADLEIIYGDRRTRAVIRLDIAEINVLVLGENDRLDDSAPGEDAADRLRSLSENIVRAPMNTVDLWRAIEALTAQHWTEDAIALALATPIKQIRKLRLLANIHPAILDQIAAGDMPKEDHLRTIAAATGEEQASVWKKLKPKKGQTASWWEIARALEKRRIYARVAKFGPDEEQAFGVVWEEDLFTQGDEDSRYTTQVDAFLAAQQAWLEAHLPKNAVLLPSDDYGQPKLPPKAERIWTKPKKGDLVGCSVNPRDGSIVEVAFRQPKPEPKKGPSAAADAESDDIAPAPKTRPDLTQKGSAIVGELRTAALGKALLDNPIDDVTLIGLLVLGFSATNVSLRTGGGYSSDDRKKIVQRLTEGGRLTQDLDVLRRAARETLASFLALNPGGMSDSGIVARFAGDAIGADQHLPNMATEEFLSCLSKSGIEKAAASIGVLPRPRAKETRAALIAQVGEGDFIHPTALFAPTEAELASHQDSLRLHQWADDEPDETDGVAPTHDGDEDAPESGQGDDGDLGPDASEDEDDACNARDDDEDDQDAIDNPSSPHAFEEHDAFDATEEDPDENAHLETSAARAASRRPRKTRAGADRQLSDA